MAVGKLNVTPVTVRGLSAPGLDGAKLFVGCFIQETEKHRTHSENGPEPYWKNTLTCTVPEGQNFLHIELVNENPNNGGIVATSKVALNQVFDQGNETKWAQLNSSSGQSYGEIKLELSFNGTNSVSSVTSSFGSMSMAGGQQASYQQTTTHSQTSTHSSSTQSESRQGSFASLGPANPIPSNYGSGTPPPFTPPAAVSYPEKSGNNTMPGSAAYGGMPVAGGLLAGGDHQKTTTINTENMTKEQFEEAKAKGSIPTWMKYGGGVLAGAAALGLTAWGAHELKEHFDHKKEEEEKLQHQTSSPVSYGSQQQHGQPQQQPYTIHNQQGQSQQYPHPPPPVQQHHSSVAEKSHCEKKDKKEHKKKDKHHKKRGSGSDSSSSSSDSSDSSDSEDEHKKKDKHHKKRDSDWH